VGLAQELATPDPASAYRLRDERIAQGRADVLRLMATRLPRPEDPVSISSELAAGLRQALAENGAYMGVERGRVSLSTEPFKPGSGSPGVFIPADVYARLLNELGMPRFNSEPHGSCATCVFARPDGSDRGWSGPCSGCGTGHPCYVPRDFEAAPKASPQGEARVPGGNTTRSGSPK
jgi:hypothetical protein